MFQHISSVNCYDASHVHARHDQTSFVEHNLQTIGQSLPEQQGTRQAHFIQASAHISVFNQKKLDYCFEARDLKTSKLV